MSAKKKTLLGPSFRGKLRSLPLEFKNENKEHSFKSVRSLLRNLGIKISEKKYMFYDFYYGFLVELEHGYKAGIYNITNDDPIITSEIALSHLSEHPFYYRALYWMEKELFD